MRTIIYLGIGAVIAALGMALRPTLMGVGAETGEQLNPSDPRKGSFVIDCSVDPRPISPLIYGIGGSGNPWGLGIAARRHGGNPSTRYNWELNTYNAANDWFFKNAGGGRPAQGIDEFLTENMAHNVKSALTVPMLGWVAKDGTSYSFPVSVFGAQKATAPELPDAGNGVGVNGKPIPPGAPTLTSVRSTPESIERLVRLIRERDATRGRSVDSYILDNEPMLWNATHRDVHPEPTTYDELLEKTIAYGSVIRRADPEAKIAGPAEWGWLAYHYSAKDTAAGVFLKPDRRQHGDEPLIPWYLKRLRDHEQKTRTKVLDILDVHFYPMADGVHAGATDPAASARRIRSTRSLWDPTYRDESWINERMRVLPLLNQWIADNYPGLGLSIGEWSFGAPNHMSGALAIAETLGRFGENGLTSAYYWGDLPEGSPGFWAFRAFRDFDREAGRFQDYSIPVKSDGTLMSLFASRDDKRRQLVVVLLNLAPLSPALTHVTLQGCGPVALARGFKYSGEPSGFATLRVGFTKDSLDILAHPYTINVIELGTAPVEDK